MEGKNACRFAFSRSEEFRPGFSRCPRPHISTNLYPIVNLCSLFLSRVRWHSRILPACVSPLMLLLLNPSLAWVEQKEHQTDRSR